MADDHTRIEQLEAQVAALIRAQHRPRRRVPRRFLPLLLAALLVALVPLATLAASPFNDLTGGVHDANIGLIYDAGITTGCVSNQQYCPTKNVTREEMASFLARTAGLGTNPPVVNARTAQTAAQATNAIHATSADTAATVGGYAPNGLLRAARTLVPNNPLASPTPGAPLSVTAVYPTFQTVGTVTINAPTAGFVLVLVQSVGISQNSHSVIVRLHDPISGEVSPFVGQDLASTTTTPAALNLQTTLSPSHLFPVAAGTRIFILEATTNLASSAPADSELVDTTISAVYLPFGYNGGTTLAP